MRREIDAIGGIRRIVVVGGGTGFEAHLLQRIHPEIDQVVVLDLGISLLSSVLKTRQHLRVEVGRADSILADFNHLPLRACAFGRETLGLSFRSLHHAASISSPLTEMLATFHRIVLVEPVWSRSVRVLARLGLANRIEHVSEKPQRLELSLLRQRGWSVHVKYLLEMPRDRLPGLQHQQGAFDERLPWPEVWLSSVYVCVTAAMGKVLSLAGFGNYACVRLERREPICRCS